MDTNEDYLVWSNGIKIQKDLVEKANQNGKYTKKNSNHYEKSISKKEDVKPLAKQNEHQKFTNPKASIIYHAVPGKGKPVAKAFPNKKESKKNGSPKSNKYESKKKGSLESKKKKKVGINGSKKENLLKQKGIKLGSFVMIENGDVYRVMAIDKNGFHIHTNDDIERYIRYSEMGKLGIDLAPNLHIGKLKLEYRQKSKLEKDLLYGLNSESIDIIIATVKKKENYLEMKPYLVPEIFNELKWDMWVTKIRNALGIKIDDIYAQKVTEKEETKNEYVIKPQNFIVMVHTFFCSSKGHNLQSIQAVILTKAFDGKGLSSVSIPAGYCEQCNRYYILSSVYEEKRFLLKNALCDFVKDSELSSYLRNHEFDSNEFRSQSILNRCGYSVSRNSLLTRSERIQLLESIITNGVLSREEVKSFINWLIRFQGSNPIMYRALIEWEIDLKSIARDSDSVVVLVKQILS